MLAAYAKYLLHLTDLRCGLWIGGFLRNDETQTTAASYVPDVLTPLRYEIKNTFHTAPVKRQ